MPEFSHLYYVLRPQFRWGRKSCSMCVTYYELDRGMLRLPYLIKSSITAKYIRVMHNP